MTLLGVLLLVTTLFATSPAFAGEVAKADLDILGLGLEVLRDPVTTPVDVPAYVQTKFGGGMNEGAPVAPGLSALAELTGPGIVTPITLAATPGHKFAIPPLHEKGEYQLQNIRLAGPNGEFLQQAIPSFAIVNVSDVLKTEVRVRQLTPEELRERGITVDLRNYDVYEYTVIFGVDEEFVEIPYPVIIDKRTHAVQPITRENSFKLPPLQQKRPPRFTPPIIEEFEFSGGGGGGNESEAEPPGAAGPRIPAAIVLPNGFGVLHQFFAVILQVSNTSPDSNIQLDNISATISTPQQMRIAKVSPSVTLGQPVPVYDAKTGTTFLIAGARGEAEWTLESLKAGTHPIDITVEADYKQQGQPEFRLRGRASTAIVVSDPRFQITFSHPDTVRTDEPYTAYAFITNLSAQAQHVRLDMSEIPACNTGAAVNHICRTEGEPIVELDIQPGEMIPQPYKMTSKITGHVFAGAGAANDEAIGVSVKLSMGVSQSGIPLSPATLVMPHYARYLPGDFIAANMQLLGLGYSLAVAPVSNYTAKFPRVIKSDVFQRAQEIARAGQRIFTMRASRDVDNPEENRDAYFHLALDLLGNVERTDHATIAPDLEEWDELRRKEVSGRRAAAAIARQLETHGLHNGRTPKQFIDDFAAAGAHRNPFFLAYVHGADVAGEVRPYALSLTGATTNAKLDVPAEATAGWVRLMANAELARFDAGSEKGELAIVGKWTETIRVSVTPRASSFTLHLVYPDTNAGAFLRTDVAVTGATIGSPVTIEVARGSRTLIVSGGSATPIVDSVPAPALRVIGAAQDLHLNQYGRLVSVLFNRPLKPADVSKLRDQFALTINVPKAAYSITRRNPADPELPLQIPAAALQQDARLINVTFDKTLSTNADYVIAVESMRDLVNQSLYSANDIVPRVDNDAPGGIVTGKVLLGDNTPIAGAEVTIDAEQSVQQIDVTDAQGRFMFEFVPRDIDKSISGRYQIEARANGRSTKADGAVRLIGEVHTVNLVFLGRGTAEGYVKYADGEVLKDVNVVIGSTLFGHFRSGHTNDQGFFSIGDLPVGPLTFSVVDPDGRTTFAASAIRFAGEIIKQDLIIERTQFPGTGTVKVSVRRADTNALIPGAHIGVYTQGYALVDAYADANGYAEFHDVPAGLISIIASAFHISRETPGIEMEMRADQIVEQTIYIGVPPPTNSGYAALAGTVRRDDPASPGDTTKDVVVPGAIITIAKLPPVTANADGTYFYPDVPTQLAGKPTPMLVFDPATGRKGWFDLPSLFANQTAQFSPRMSSSDPNGEATVRVRLTSATGAPVTDYRVMEPGFPPEVFAHVGNGVYELTGVRVPRKVAIVAVPTNPNGPWGEQMATGSARVDFGGQIGIVDMRLPGQGTIITRLELRQDQDACPTSEPCYTQAFGKVAVSYSVWDETEQSTKAKTVIREADPVTQLNTFTKIPARQGTGVYTDRHPAGFASAAVTLAYDGDVHTLTLRMDTIGDVTGRVFAYDRQTPVAGALVKLENDRVIYGQQLTKPDGSFRFAGVPAGLAFRIVAENTRDGIYRKGYADGSTPAAGGPVSNLIVVMREQSNIEGQVVDADGAPVPLARYSLSELAWPYTKYGTEQEPLQADINGRFYLTNVFTGPFRMTARSPVIQEQRGNYQGELRFEGDTSQLQIVIAIGDNGLGTVTARVVDSSRAFAIVENAEVKLFRGDYPFDLSSTNEHGVVTFTNLPAGNQQYWLTAYSKAAGRAGSTARFTLASGATVERELVLEFLGKVAGFVTDPEDQNRASIGDPVQMESGQVIQRTSTDGEGKFSIYGVPEGPFKLFAYDLESGRMAFGPSNLFISKVVQEYNDLHLELERTAVLTVNVHLPTDNGGQGELAPLVDVLVEAHDYYREAQGQSLQFPKMIPRYGYKITARELGGEHRTVVGHGSWPADTFTKTHSLTFPSTGSVEVKVLDNQNQPVVDAMVQIGGTTIYTPADGIVRLTGIPFGWISVRASKGSLGASDGKLLQSRSIPLQFTLNLGATIDVEGFVEAEEGIGVPSGGTRVLIDVSSSLISSQRRLETFTGPDGRFRFAGIPVGNTVLRLKYYGPDDTTIGAEPAPQNVPNNQTGTYVVTPVKLDATPPRVLKIVPPANENNVSPGTNVEITFSEAIAASFLTTQYLQVRANDDPAVVNMTIQPSVRPDGTFIVTLIPPAPPAGQKYPLKSNMLYRITVAGGIQDTTGNAMSATVGSSFTTVNYTEPAVVRVTPSEKEALASNATFYIKFNKQIDIDSLKPEYGGVIRLEKLDTRGGVPVATVPLAPPYLDPGDSTVVIAAPTGVAIEESSFYRLTIDKIRDKQVPPNIQKDIKIVEFFSFDNTPPVAVIQSPVAEGEKLVSGVLYTATVKVFDKDTTNEADDVESVTWLDADGKYLTLRTVAPYGYAFEAPATEVETTYTLQVAAKDLSGNPSPSAQAFTWQVVPNAAPSNVTLVLTPTSAYPTHKVKSDITFNDEGVKVTVSIKLTGKRLDGSDLNLELDSKQITRATTTAPWPAVSFESTLPLDLLPGTAQIVASVKDVSKTGTAAANLEVLADTIAPEVVSSLPKAETRYAHKAPYTVELKVRDLETGVDPATIAITIAGTAADPTKITKTFDAATGVHTFRYDTEGGARNADTRIPIVVTVQDKRSNVTTVTTEIIYERVDDATVPQAAWITPLDGAALPYNVTGGYQPTLRIQATDDSAVTKVRFESDRFDTVTLTAPKSGTTNIYEAKVTLRDWGTETPVPFVIRAFVEDAEPSHTVELPITVDPVNATVTLSSTTSISSVGVDQYVDQNVVVKGTNVRVTINVPLRVKNLMIVDGANVSAFEETKLDLTVTERLFIDANSKIDVTDKGYLGGLRTGELVTNKNTVETGRTLGGTTTGGATSSATAADGSHAGIGGEEEDNATNATYGSITNPLDFGAGGSATSTSSHGGNGGGVVHVRGNTAGTARLVIAGLVRADGGTGAGRSGAGAGGSINLDGRIVVTGPVTRITANGGDDDGNDNASQGGGGGRIAVRAAERFDFTDRARLLQSRGGRNGSNDGATYVDGGAGTIFVAAPGATNGELIVSAFEESAPNSTGKVRGTPLAGTLTFDAITIGPRTVARFDNDYTVPDPGAFTAHATALVLTPADVPTVTLVSTTPAAGAQVAQKTSIAATFTASSIAGVTRAKTTLSVQPTPKFNVFGTTPQTTPSTTASLEIPDTTPPGETTLTVLVTDRAGRTVATTPVAFSVVDNAAPVITDFTVTPAAEVYANGRIDVTITATDDVGVTNITLTSSHGTPLSGPWGGSAVTPRTRTYHWNLAKDLASGTQIVLTATATDGFPGRVPVTRTHTLVVKKDEGVPALTIVKPQPGQVINEVADGTFDLEVAASDAEVAVKSVTAVFEGQPHTLTLVSGTTYRKTGILLPDVDGTENVAKSVSFTVTDYDNNATTDSVSFFIKPLVDALAPELSWNCTSPNAMYPAGMTVPLRVTAAPRINPETGQPTGTSKVELSINGGPEQLATRNGDVWTYNFQIPNDAAPGTVFNVRAKATSTSNNVSTILGSFSIVGGSAPQYVTINTRSFINADDTAYTPQTTVVVVSGGELVVVGPHTLKNVVVLEGGKLVQQHLDVGRADLLTVEKIYVACGAQINVTGLGYAKNTSYPGAGVGDDASGGSHIGRGGVWRRAAGGAFGNIYRPAEGGGGAHFTASTSVANAGSGGGSVRINATATAAFDGAIYANGVGSNTHGTGGGGSVWIVTPTLSGGGSIEAISPDYDNHGGGGGGAIAIEYGTATGKLLERISARGGNTNRDQHEGSAGSIFIRSGAAQYGELTIDNTGVATVDHSHTELPAFGRAAAQSVSGDVVTLEGVRFVPPSMLGRSVRAVAADGNVRGTWTISAIEHSAKAVTGHADVPTQDAFAYDGYLLYSPAGISGRNFVAARYANSRWEYDDGSTFLPFNPQTGDLVFASFTKDATRITGLTKFDCNAGCAAVHGLAAGELVSGEIAPNSIGGSNNGGQLMHIGLADDAEFFLRPDGRYRGLVVAPATEATITLVGNNVQPGDLLQGVYLFDKVRLKNARVVTEDVVVAPVEKDATSSIVSANTAAPAINAAAISIVPGVNGPVLTGLGNTVTDTEPPVDLFVRNATASVAPQTIVWDRVWDSLIGTRGGASVERVTNALVADYGVYRASAFNTITSEGALTFGVSQTNQEIVVGLAPADTTGNYAEPGTNAFKLNTNGTYEVWAGGASVAGKNGGYSTITAFRIEKTPAALRWLVNGAIVHEVTTSIPPSLRLDISFQNASGGAVHSIEMRASASGSAYGVADATGGIRVPLTGAAGDVIRLRATDRHRFPLTSAEVDVATMPSNIGVASVTLAQSEITGGRSTTGTVTLLSAAGSEGALVKLTGSSTAITIPTSVSVQPNATTATFTIAAQAVTTQTDVTITAAYGLASANSVLRIVPDASAPAITIEKPLANAEFNEGNTNNIAVQVVVVDQDSGVATVVAKLDAQTVALTKNTSLGPNTWTGNMPSPFVEGSANVTKTLSITATDVNGNAATESVSIVIRPATAGGFPTITWACSSDNAIYPVGYGARLRVDARAPVTNPPNQNPLQKVEITITDPNGVATTVNAPLLSGTLYEYVFTIPDVPDGSVFNVHAVAITAFGTDSAVDSRIVVVKGATEIKANATIAATDTSYDNKSIVVWEGVTLTIAGAHTFDKVSVLPNGRITHPASSGATYERVNITANAVYVACTAAIDANGKGYVGQSNYYGRTWPGTFTGSHLGAGASHGGRGGDHDHYGASTPVNYGSVVDPDTPGASGGSWSWNTCDWCEPGGGIVRITANTLSVDGAISARGLNNNGGGGGAGGSIRLKAKTLSGVGEVRADGAPHGHAGGSGGRVALHYETLALDRAKISAAGGTNVHSDRRKGGAGTVYLRATSPAGAKLSDELVVDNAAVNAWYGATLSRLGSGTLAAVTGAELSLSNAVPEWVEGSYIELLASDGSLLGSYEITARTPTSVTVRLAQGENITAPIGSAYRGVWRFDTVTVQREATLDIDGLDVVSINGGTTSETCVVHDLRGDAVVLGGRVVSRNVRARKLTLTNGTLVQLGQSTNSSSVVRLTIDVAETLTVDANSAIDATGGGFVGQSNYYGRTWPGTYTGSHLGSGGTHGGRGGDHDHYGSSDSVVYGSIMNPDTPGASGGSWSWNTCDWCEPGGGILRIKAPTISLAGKILANGLNNNGGGGGAGGSIRIDTDTIAGSGEVRADGAPNGHAGGSGGRVAIYSQSFALDPLRVTAAGGTNVHSDRRKGGAGTVYLRRVDSTGNELSDELVVDNRDLPAWYGTTIPSVGSGTVVSVSGNVLTLSNPVPEWIEGSTLELLDATGAVTATYEIVSRTATTVTLRVPAGQSLSVNPGTAYRGTWSIDTITVRRRGIVTGSGAFATKRINGGGSTEFLNLPEILVDEATFTGYFATNKVTARRLTLNNARLMQLGQSSTSTALKRLVIDVSDTLVVDSGSSITANGGGFVGQSNYYGRSWPGAFNGSHLGAGGSHGGSGGDHDHYGLANPATYGSMFDPDTPGASGGSWGWANCDWCEPGGGIIRLTAKTVLLDGVIESNGVNNNGSGGGAGGSIRIDVDALNGAGSIRAEGASHGNAAGGGGRVAVYYNQLGLDPSRITAAGGTNVHSNRRKGAAGTVFLKGSTQTYGSLTIDNRGIPSTMPTLLPSIGFRTATAATASSVTTANANFLAPDHFRGTRIYKASDASVNWPITANTADTLQVDTTAAPLTIAAGDMYRGALMFDSIRINYANVYGSDAVSPAATITNGSLSINDGPPVVTASKIAVESTATADAVVGTLGAVTDANQPVKLTITNNRTAVAVTGNANNDGSFRINVAGAPGDTFTLVAADSHYMPASAPPIAVSGTIGTFVQPSLEISPSTVVVGAAATAVVRLAQPALKTTEMMLQRSNTNVTIPASITFASGEAAKQFPINTTAAGAVTITVTHGTSSSATLNVVSSEAAALSAITLSATTVEGGASVNGTVTLGAPAPAGGATVLLYSSSDRVSVPQAVVVAAGDTEASFTVVTSVVGSTTSAIISGTWGESKTATLALTACQSLSSVVPPSDVLVNNVWIEDAAPAGATPAGDAAFDDSQVATGSLALHFSPPVDADLRTWTLTGATTPLAVLPSDSLVFYLLVNPCKPPKQLAVTWKAGAAEYRATWGEARIDVTLPHKRFGAVPDGGEWVRMEIAASRLGITAATNIDALTVQAYLGEVWLDRIGATACTIPTAPPPAADDHEVVWFDDALPAGAVVDAPTSTRNNWTWVSTQVASGSLSHVEGPQAGLHEHAFYNTSQGMLLRQGDMLFTYVFLDPCNPPQEVMLNFYDGSWEHRAYWGENAFTGWGTDGTGSRIRMGPLPELGKWVRLEVPASFVGLEDRTVTGAAYVLVDGRAWFDRVGKYSRVNLAQGKKIAQNNQYSNFVAEWANDGRLDTFNHNNGGNQGWLEVDLGAVQPIDQIQVWNRWDCCSERLSNHYVMVSDKPFSTDTANISQADGASKYHWSGTTSGVPYYVLDINRTGRYVRVQLAGNNYLHLRELQVWAPAATKRVNVASGAVASQSSIFDSVSLAPSAVNGHHTAPYNWGPSVFRTASGAESWFEVDLGKVTSISKVDLFSRIGAAATDLSDFYVFISDLPFTGTTVAESLAQSKVSALYYGNPSFTMHSLQVNRTGRYVRIQKRTAGELAFAEVRLWSQTNLLGALAKPPAEK